MFSELVKGEIWSVAPLEFRTPFLLCPIKEARKGFFYCLKQS